MKSLLTVMSVAVAVLASAQVAKANLIWADDVEAYSANIQNYGYTTMDASTTWWLTGPPDGDSGDYVGGWRTDAPSEFIVMHWDSAIPDLSGDDLVIRLYCGSLAKASVLASVDGTTFTNVGTIGGGTTGIFRQESFDFDGQFGGDISYVKVERVANGAKTGMFFDAFGGVPDPGADFDGDGDVDEEDLLAWQTGFGTSTDATHSQGDADGDRDVDGGDFLVWQKEFGSEMGGDSVETVNVPEPGAMTLLSAAAGCFALWRRQRSQEPRVVSLPYFRP